MSITIPHPETGEPVEVFARLIESTVGCDYIEILLRADSREAWQAAAIANGLLRQDEGEEAPYPVYGVNIDEIGPVTITPATYDEEGNETSPAVLDTRHHVNCRISADLNWQPIALAWLTYGQPDEPNKTEEAVELSSIALINPDTINTPARVFA